MARTKLPASPTGKEKLSPGEHEILGWLAEGLSNKEIADRASLSTATICNHLHHIYDKLHVNCRTEALMKYTQGGLTRPSA